MYRWKCWHEYGKFALGMILLFTIFICWMDSLVMADKYYSNGAAQNTAQHMSQMKHGLEDINAGLILLSGWIAALFSSSTAGIGMEYDSKTTEFLFTRPRRRRWLMWTNWLSGVIAIACVMLIPLIISAIYCYVRAQWVLDARMFAVVLAAAPVNLMLFGLAQFGGVVLKGAPRGSIFALIVYGIYTTVLMLLRSHFGFQTPQWWFDKLTDILRGSGVTPFFCEVAALWLLVALAIPFATQKLLEHRDMA